MPRKTKKTSIAKPAVTKKKECQFDFDGALLILAGIIGTVGLGCMVLNMFSTSIPEVGSCYQLKESILVHAKVQEIGYGNDDNTHITYDVVERFKHDEDVQNKLRLAGDFNSIYKKSDDCNEFEITKLENANDRLYDKLFEAELQLIRLRAKSK